MFLLRIEIFFWILFPIVAIINIAYHVLLPMLYYICSMIVIIILLISLFIELFIHLFSAYYVPDTNSPYKNVQGRSPCCPKFTF